MGREGGGERDVLSEELWLQELFEVGQGCSCAHRAQELVPPSGNEVRQQSGLLCRESRLCQAMIVFGRQQIRRQEGSTGSEQFS